MTRPRLYTQPELFSETLGTFQPAGAHGEMGAEGVEQARADAERLAEAAAASIAQAAARERAQADEPEAPRRRTYRERRLARAERLEGWAEGRAAKAAATHQRFESIAEHIPPGQPILAGHHSQRRHERDAGRMDSALRASVEHSQKADEHQRRAENIRAQAERAIYSDDADAVERLRERIAALEAERDARKPGIAAYNRSAKRGRPDPSLLHPKDRADLAHPSLANFITRRDGTFWPGRLKNLTAEIARNKKRLAELEASA